MSETVSAIIQRKLPPKLKDPGSFSISCIIGNTSFDNVMLDLGASINVMPLNVYQSLSLGPLKSDNVIIQLADCSNKYPEGYVEDVLMQVNNLIFPADFYVLDVESNTKTSTPLLLGCPFMRTARTKIDVFEGNLTMEFDGEIIHFNIFDTMRYLIFDLKMCEISDMVDSIAQTMSETLYRDADVVAIECGVTDTLDHTSFDDAWAESDIENTLMPMPEPIDVVAAIEA